MTYIILPITRDPTVVIEQGMEVVRARYPNWQPSDADLMTLMIRATGVMYADTATLATQAAAEILRYFGRTVAGIPPTEASPAVGQVTFTVPAAHVAPVRVVPEDLQIMGRDATGTLRGFRTTAATIKPAATATVTVTVEATEDGTASNGISGDVEQSNYIDYLASGVFIGVTSGGTDRQDDEDYLDELVDEFTLLSPKPILPGDFAVIGRRLAGVGARATAIAGLNPVDDTTGNARTITVALVDAAGEDFSGPTMTAIASRLEGMTLANFDVFVIGADERTPIDVSVSGVCELGKDPAEIEAAVTARLVGYLSPAAYGSTERDALAWQNRPTIRYLEIAEQVNRTPGFDYIETLEIAADGGLLDDVNVTMDGYAPLPEPGDITVDISEPS